MIVVPESLNMRSGPGAHFRKHGRLAMDARVEILEIWSDAKGAPWAFVEDFRSFGAWVAFWLLRPPNGRAEIEELFGEPGKLACSEGVVELPAPLKVGWSTETVKRVSCHERMVPIFKAVFREIHEAGLWQKIRTFDGIYNYRPVKTAKAKLSTHAWGISIDLDAATNRPGMKGDLDPGVRAIFKKYGFKDGKDFGDPMHQQWATGY